MEEKKRNLAPVKKVRKVTPHVCATCKFGIIEDGGFVCQREGGYTGDTGDLDLWYHVCEHYKASPTGHAEIRV